jgi:hypothetical protein
MRKISDISIMSLTFALVFAAGTVPVAFAASTDDTAVVGTPSITEATAFETAGNAYTGTGTFTDIELEMEGDVLVYAVEFTESDGNEVDVKINAKTGAVLLIESDKDESVDDDAGDEEEDSTEVGRIQTLINLLNQLLTLLRAQA